MARAKQIHDRNTIMPRLDKGAAGRFVRNSLWVPVPRADEANEITPNENSTTNNENWDT